MMTQTQETKQHAGHAERELTLVKRGLLEDIAYHYKTWGVPTPFRIISLRYAKRIKKLLPELGLVGFIKQMHKDNELYYIQTQKGNRYLMGYEETLKLVSQGEFDSLISALEQGGGK